MRDSLPVTTLHALRWQFAALDVEAKLVRLRLALKLFNPLQPRVPAGNPDGGRWTRGNASDQADDGSLIQPAAGRERDRISGAELAKDPYLNRHIVDRHVGKTDAEMIECVADSYRRKVLGLLPPTFPLIRDGSFDSIESARTFIRETLEKNRDAVQRVAEGLEVGRRRLAQVALRLSDRSRGREHPEGYPHPHADDLWRRRLYSPGSLGGKGISHRHGPPDE